MDNKYIDKVSTHSAIINDTVVHGIPDGVCYINDALELNELADIMPVGSLAITYGFENIWQLMPDGQWAPIIRKEQEDA